jgi:23S rRNA (cytidine1920-2'-O)/16S rRNA (cytidine1409-2'-O)-methyltransferase
MFTLIGYSMKKQKERLDVLVVQQGLAPSRERAQALIMEGKVKVNGQVSTKQGMLIETHSICTLADTPPELKYVSRGGLKLERALASFSLSPLGLTCLDIGASTGGFTDCLLEHGATKVYAIDVGYGQIAWKLRQDSRVIVMDRVNIRHVTSLPECPQCIVIDVSFISLRHVLPVAESLLRCNKECTEKYPWVVALVKPQFEAGKADVDRGSGVIRDTLVHARVIHEFRSWVAIQTSFIIQSIVDSPILGREGNREFLAYLTLTRA